MTARDESLDLMAPIETATGTVWVKVGVYFPNPDGRGNYAGTVSILTLPVGAAAPLRLYAYPQSARGKYLDRGPGSKPKPRSDLDPGDHPEPVGDDPAF